MWNPKNVSAELRAIADMLDSGRVEVNSIESKYDNHGGPYNSAFITLKLKPVAGHDFGEGPPGTALRYAGLDSGRKYGPSETGEADGCAPTPDAPSETAQDDKT
jgi:hypothetical protein